MGHERNIVIQATPKAGNPGEYTFVMLEKGQAADLTFNKDNSKLKKSQYYVINFTLDNVNNAGLRFSKDPEKVLWSKYVPSLTSPCILQNEECHLREIFVDPATPIQDLSLTVINVDRTENFFALAFNFLPPGANDGPGTTYAFYDPIGSNQDGGSNTLASAEVIGGLLVGAAIGGALTVALS